MSIVRSTSTALVLAGLALASSGCGEACKNEPPAVFQAPTNCGTLRAGEVITVGVTVCPSCENLATCAVRTDELSSSGIVELEPQAEVCEDSCPSINPGSCPFRPLTCQFTAPAASREGGYSIWLYDPFSPGGFRDIPFDVATAGATTCGVGSAAGI